MADERGEPSTLVASIDDDAKGRWQITTETGSTYVVDLDQRVITRVPELRALRHDHESLLLHRVIEARVGDTGCFLVQVRSDGVPTLRLTSHVTPIRPAPAWRRSEVGQWAPRVTAPFHHNKQPMSIGHDCRRPTCHHSPAPSDTQ
ncbi:hypothetical protein IEQ44_05915 [Nocardioides sp. Y6]|uniref:Uncharacterized protein n=1 Tax=Nocardioides malaquae TaxID=2773426 RepID=A0ABR9RSN4_9ACTN|nr:hypothetical protein [Nocardioides malaquae]MBE7324182.1 hypothetical protein [Nocardioides malaquae]